MSILKKTLGELCIIEKGKVGIQKAIPGEYPLVVTAEERLSHNEYHFEGNAVVIPLVSSTGHGHKSLKRIHFQTGKFAVGNILCAVLPKDETELNAEYLYRFLDLNREKELVGRMKGMANVSLPLKEIAQIEIPLPPLEEQIKFVEDYKQLEVGKNKLDAELAYQFELVKQLRQAFLREAMQGKLTKDWRDSHPELVSGSNSASELLAKIKADKEELIKGGKLKKTKLLAPIKVDKISFKIPKNWVWCNIEEIAEVKRGISPNYSEKGIFKMLNQKCVRCYVLDKEHSKAIDEEWYYSLDENFKVVENDLLVNSTGDGTIGRSAITDVNCEGYVFDSHILRVRAHQKVNQKLLCLIINSSYGQAFIEGIKGATSTKQTELGVNNLLAFSIPLPPFYEQQKIVTKLDELMQYCDQLEASIKNSHQQNELLLQQVLREALEPKIKNESKVINFKTRKCNSSEKAILAGHIINQTNSEDFGRVKFQKLLYLVEHHCKLDLSSNYQRKVAGPHDGELLSEIESTLELHRFYKIRQSNEKNHRVSYTALSYASELEDLYTENFSSESSELDEFLSKFKNSTWEQCEIVATLYAVWNNRIIRQEQITDELLKQDFLNWDKKKIKYQDRLDGALEWMKRKIIIPDGWGKVIE